MANKAISELPQAQNVNNQDLFVLEQSGIAKKLTAETFITEQGIIDALAEALDGHGGIQSVTLASVSGRIRTYRITFSDGSATTFQVYDGTSIDRISRTSSSGLQDTYTIFMSDGTTTFFTVTNGADGTVSEAMLNDALKGKAPAITETTESSAIATFTDGADDMPLHNILAEINPVQDLNGYDAPWPSGGKNQLIFKTISGNIESNGRIVSTQDFYLVVAEVTANQTYVYSVNGVAVASGGIVAAYYSSEPDINSISYDGQRITTGQNPFIAPITGYVAIRATSGSGAQRQIESGSTPTPYYPYSNICPITGHMEANVTRMGKNLADFTNGYGIGQNGLPSEYAKRSSTVTPIVIKSDCTYKGICTGTNVFLIYSVFDASGTLVRRVTAVTSGTTLNTDGGAYLYVCGYDSADVNTITAEANQLMVIEGSETDTTYEPYTATTVSLSWQTEAGTVYGGTIDVATGLLTVDRVMITIGGSSVSAVSGSGYSSFQVTTSSGIKAKNANSEIVCLSSAYRGESFNTAPVTGDNYIFASGGNIRIKDLTNASLSAAEYKEKMQDVQIAYLIATPQTYQLTPQEVIKTLLGTNNVWADTGNVSVTYPADTKMFIEKLTMPTEDDLVANQAITSGKYFMIGNSLYLALANIASGAQITIGTNAQRVSLADALNNINS